MTVRGRPCFVHRRVSSHHFRQSASHLLRSRALTPAGRPSASQPVSQSVRCLSVDESQVNETHARTHTQRNTAQHMQLLLGRLPSQGPFNRGLNVRRAQSINQSINRPTNQPNRCQWMVEPPPADRADVL